MDIVIDDVTIDDGENNDTDHVRRLQLINDSNVATIDNESVGQVSLISLTVDADGG